MVYVGKLFCSVFSLFTACAFQTIRLLCDLFSAFLAPSVPMRGGGRGMRGMGRGRGNPRMNDIFRSRKQNTSRPPSMHVDDFMAMEHAKTQDSPPMRRPGPKVGEKTQKMQYLYCFDNCSYSVILFCYFFFQGPPIGRTMDHGPGGFMDNQGRWTGMPGGPLRKGTTGTFEPVTSRHSPNCPSVFSTF